MKGFLIVAILVLTTSSVFGDFTGACKGQPLGKIVNHPDGCDKFVVCIGGGVAVNCPPGTHFRKDLQVCDWIERAGCSTGSSEPDVISVETKMAKGSSGENTSPFAGECKGQPLGKRVKHPSSCEKFVVCIGGGVEMDCPPKTHFSTTYEVCDWIERAGC